MSKYLDKFGLEHYHDLIKSGLFEYIVGTQSSATSTWTGVSTQPDLFAGKLIIYHLPYAGSSAVPTLNLTLPDNTTTGAKTVGTRVGTSYSAGSNIILVYTGTAWDVVEADGSNLIANRAVVSDANGKLIESNVTSTELGYLSGVTSGVQGQIETINSVFNNHQWFRYSDLYEGVRTANTMTKDSTTDSKDYVFVCTGNTFNVHYSKSLVSTPNGIALADPIQIEIIGSSQANELLCDSYFTLDSVPSGANAGFNTNTIYYVTEYASNFKGILTSTAVIKANLYVVNEVFSYDPTTEDVVSDTNPSAYPNPSGHSGGYYYIYTGKVVDKLNGHLPMIASGSYYGTGTYGADNPNSITFPFKPKLVFLFYTHYKAGISSGSVGLSIPYNNPLQISRLTTEYTQYRQLGTNGQYASNGYGKISEDGKTIYWYNTYTGSNQQNNISGATYTWYAIG